METPFFDWVESRATGKRCLACTIAAGINIPLKGHKGLCPEAMIYAGKKAAVLREMKHLEGMYDPAAHDSMTRQTALEILSSAYDNAVWATV